VCLSTGGPGATHLITGLYDAKMDHAPVLAICEATVRGASYEQELNLDRMFADVAGFVQEASSPDIQDEEYGEPVVAHGFTRSGVGRIAPPERCHSKLRVRQIYVRGSSAERRA